MRTVSELLLGVLESCSGDGGALSLTVLQKQVGTQLLPLHLPGATDIYLDMKKTHHMKAILKNIDGTLIYVDVYTITCNVFFCFFLNQYWHLFIWALFLLTSLKNLSTHVSSISGPITDLRTSRNSSKWIPRSSFSPLFLALLLFGLFSCVRTPAPVNAFLRSCRCSGLSFSAGLTPPAGSLQKGVPWSFKGRFFNSCKIWTSFQLNPPVKTLGSLLATPPSGALFFLVLFVNYSYRSHKIKNTFHITP